MGQGRRHSSIRVSTSALLLTMVTSASDNTGCFLHANTFGAELSNKNSVEEREWPETLFCLHAVRALICSAISCTFAFQCLRKLMYSISMCEKCQLHEIDTVLEVGLNDILLLYLYLDMNIQDINIEKETI